MRRMSPSCDSHATRLLNPVCKLDCATRELATCSFERTSRFDLLSPNSGALGWVAEYSAACSAEPVGHHRPNTRRIKIMTRQLPRKRLLQGFVLLGGFALIATGCSTNVSDDAKDTQTTVSSDTGTTIKGDNVQTTEIDGDVTNVDNGYDDADDADNDTTDVPDAADTRDITDPEWLEAAASSEKTINGGPSVNITESDTVITIKGDCESLNILGANVTVLAEDISVLSITGSNVKVFGEEIGTVQFTGSDNTIVWSDVSEPTVGSELGTNNTIRRAE
ncbi:hypothetical protein DDD63_00870 [Actinobaculum sp. 313]|nr:hypothetical protein DDD63_00870 [Actinobaculum sp. 313]